MDEKKAAVVYKLADIKVMEKIAAYVYKLEEGGFISIFQGSYERLFVSFNNYSRATYYYMGGFMRNGETR